MNLKNRIVATVAVAALALPAFAYAKVSKGKDNKTGFMKFNVPLTAGSIDGGVENASDITVKEDGADTVITADLRNVKTGIPLRDGHFQKMLKKVNGKDSGDAGKDLVLKVPTASIVKDGKEHKVDGMLDTKAEGDKPLKVTVTYKVEKYDAKYKVMGSYSFDYTKFYEAQTYLGVGAKPTVSVKAEFFVDDK
jgi:hypothetical protein